MKPEDFKNTKPSLLIEEYFDGKVKAWGILQDRTLDEDFYWTDGEKQKRTWKIKKIDDNNYVGTAPDVVGEATGVQYGSAFKFKYDLMVPFKNKNIKISFDDWIFKQDEKVAINRATLTKFGFKVGELTVFFMRD